MDRMPAGASPAIQMIGALHDLQASLEAALEPLGLSLAKLGLLARLVEAGDPVPLGTLAERCSCVRSNITQLLDRLEAGGLVARVEDPEDRRLKRAVLTDAGRRQHAEGLRAIERAERALFARLAPERCEQLLGLLRDLQTRS